MDPLQCEWDLQEKKKKKSYQEYECEFFSFICKNLKMNKDIIHYKLWNPLINNNFYFNFFYIYTKIYYNYISTCKLTTHL
jgi:hypothetical protein